MPHKFTIAVDDKVLYLTMEYIQRRDYVHMLVTEPAVDEHWDENPDVLDDVSRAFVERYHGICPDALQDVPQGVYLGVLYNHHDDPAVSQALRASAGIQFFLDHYRSVLGTLKIAAPQSIYDAILREAQTGNVALHYVDHTPC